MVILASSGIICATMTKMKMRVSVSFYATFLGIPNFIRKNYLPIHAKLIEDPHNIIMVICIIFS